MCVCVWGGAHCPHTAATPPPSIRFIVMLRDPVERAASLANMRYSRRGEAYAAQHPNLDATVTKDLADRAERPTVWPGDLGNDYVSNGEYGAHARHSCVRVTLQRPRAGPACTPTRPT